MICVIISVFNGPPCKTDHFELVNCLLGSVKDSFINYCVFCCSREVRGVRVGSIHNWVFCGPLFT